MILNCVLARWFFFFPRLTCFGLHCLIQAVYSMPTENVTDIEKSIPVALQRLFYRMQTSDDAVDTTLLTQSFGRSSGERYSEVV